MSNFRKNIIIDETTGDSAKVNTDNEVKVVHEKELDANITNANLDVIVKDETTGDSMRVDDSGQAHVVMEGIVDTGNSSSSLLLAGETFTGVAVDTLKYAIIFVNAFSDVESAINGLHIDLSSDGIVWRQGDSFTIPANGEKTFSFQPSKRFFRIEYINGAIDQGVFDLHVVLKKTNSKPSSHKISDAISPEDDATLQKSVLTALSDSGLFENVGSTLSNNLRVANAEDGLSIAKGDVVNTTFTHKFGSASDFDTGDGAVTVWDGANDSDIAEMQYTYSTTADIDSLSSTSAGDTQDIEVQGLDSNYDLVVQTITLTGQTRVALTTPLIRIFRLKNVGSVDIVGFVYCYVNGATTGGRPSNTIDIRAVIDSGNNQTLMAVFTIPNNTTGYLRSFFAASAGAKKTTNFIIRLRARPFGQVFQLKNKTSIPSDGAGLQYVYDDPEKFTAKTDIEMTAQITAGAVTQASVSAGFDLVLITD